MNAEQRKRIMVAQLEISKQQAVLDDIRNENQEAFDNLPEGLQQAEKGQEMEQAVTWLEDALSSLEEVDSALSNF